MAAVCQEKICSMARDVAGPIYLRNFIGLARQAARRASQSLFLISMLRRVEDGGIGLFLISQERSWRYLRAQAPKNQEGYLLLAFNAEMITGFRDMEDLVLRLDQPIDIW